MKGLEGGTEIEIVYSSLEEFMSDACMSNWEYAVEKNINFRDACLARAIQKVADHYDQCGIMI